MTENDEEKDNFGEFENLAAVLRATDLSGKSKVRESLKARLLNRDIEEKKPFFSWRWALPVAAAAMAALILAVVLPHKNNADRAYSASYNIPTDSYGDCGRQGLKDYQAAPRF